ncbi:hypothetical protein V2W45_1237913, partial [Cenococcum geophilum]
AYYAIIKGNIHEFYIAPIKTYYTSILDKVDNIIIWGARKFLKGVVERLGIVARRAKSGGA